VRRVVDRRVDDAKDTTRDDERRRKVSALSEDTDEAIRIAAKLAIDAGDLTRARALLELLDAKPNAMTALALVRGKGGGRAI
jgi:hypothetical protein